MSKTIWQKELQESITSIEQLTEALKVVLPFKINQHFPIKATPLYVSLIEKSNPFDPLLLQIICPSTQPLPSFTESPLKEENFSNIPGLIHKYHSRVLILLSTHCFIHCQYCFRQHFPYQDHSLSSENWDKIIEYIKNNQNIDEVILSGGDPLSVGSKYLQKIIKDIETIPHVKTLRFHTRILSVLPARLDDELFNILKSTLLNVVIVTHINHPNEICEENRAVFQSLANVATLLNQSVLLKHINDNAKTLAQLSHALFSCKIIPYYLHFLDPVKGSEFYHLSPETALAIVSDLKSLLSGYLMPRFVKEEPGKQSKTVMT
ncbi:MAG: KamA family radical SAM protein [Gammaproteobacteria bacterium]|nr:KamA family radical SAM protein [Gammaproteobacteria bacterium]